MSRHNGIRQGGLTAAGLRRWHDERPAVAVGIPMLETVWRTAFWQFMFLMKELRDDDQVLPIHRSATPGDARNEIIRTFLALPESVEYLFLFDSDMVVPAQAVDFLSWTQAPFMSGYCCWKSPPYTPTPAFYTGSVEYQGAEVPRYNPVTNWLPNTGLHVCDGVGAAALCLRRDLLEAVGDPWFVHEDGGEDYAFCRKVQALGFDIVVNTNCEIGHIGERVAHPRDFFAERDAGRVAVEAISAEVPAGLTVPWKPQLEVERI